MLTYRISYFFFLLNLPIIIPPSTPLLPGLSFLVFDLEAAIAHLKDSEVGNVNELGIRRVQGLPRFVSLIDPVGTTTRVCQRRNKR